MVYEGVHFLRPAINTKLRQLIDLYKRKKFVFCVGMSPGEGLFPQTRSLNIPSSRKLNILTSEMKSVFKLLSRCHITKLSEWLQISSLCTAI